MTEHPCFSAGPQLSGEEVSAAGQRGPAGESGRRLLQSRRHQERHPQV